MSDAWLLELASALAGEAVGELEVVRGGGNNRLYRVRGARRAYALKRYPDDPRDGRERIEREFGGLRFLWDAGERRVPEPVACDAGRGVALYGWIAGERIGDRTDADVDALAAFARGLHALRDRPAAGALPLAREAVLSRAELVGQLRRRIVRLRAEATAPPAPADLLAQIESLLAALGPADADELARDRQTLSPSDFGLHNALRTPSGLSFLDFEYFGWDDPVKLVADVLWHPGMALDAAERQRFFGHAADAYRVDRSFQGRFERDAPLYGLRWALIVLNEFLPDVWQRRVAAGEAASHRSVLERQTAKAVALVGRVRGGGPLP